MKLTDLINDAGHPVAYYPRLRLITGSTNATLLLCQLIYWCGKQKNSNGWIMKRAALVQDDPDGSLDPENQSLEYETGLTYKELWAARRRLLAKGLIRERPNRLEHRIYFQVNFKAIHEAWAHMMAGQLPKGKLGNAQRSFRELPMCSSLNGTYIDYTETTAESPAAAAGEAHVPEEPDEQLPTTPIEAMRHPAIQLFQQICGRIPGAREYEVVIEMMHHFRKHKGEQTVEYLRPFWLAWSSRRRRSDGKLYDPGSLTWLTEWALNGTVPPEYGGSDGTHQRHNAASMALTATDIAAAGRINRRRREASLPHMQ